MLHRRRLIVATAALAIGLPQFVRAQSSTADAEAALLQTVRAYFAAWNRRDTEAWAQFLAEDIEWVYAYSNLKKGRATVAAYGASALRQYDAKLEVVKLKLYDGGTRATVLLRGQMLELPVRDGKYVRAFDRDPLLARWRLEGATWRMYYMNQNVPESEELAKAEGLD